MKFVWLKNKAGQLQRWKVPENDMEWYIQDFVKKIEDDAVGEMADTIAKVIVAKILGVKIAKEQFSPEYKYASKRLEERMARGYYRPVKR